MDEREAIKIIECGYHDWNSIYSVLAVAVNALKMHIPKETIVNEDEGYIKCPSCGGLIAYLDDPESHKFCLLCGQRLEIKRNAGN